MKIVIDIPENRYKYMTSHHELPYDLSKIIRKGTILPKGHGRLIDADALEVNIADDWHTGNEIANCIKSAPTIIDTDKEIEE